MDDEAGLLGRARQGDEAAFSRLFARHQRAIDLFAARMSGADAGDDVQETFLAVLRQTRTFDPTCGTVAAYLLGIARHLVLKRLGALYRSCATGNVATAECVATQEDVLESLSRAETIDAVRAAVQSLPPVYREVVVLCKLQELDYATPFTNTDDESSLWTRRSCQRITESVIGLHTQTRVRSSEITGTALALRNRVSTRLDPHRAVRAPGGECRQRANECRRPE